MSKTAEFANTVREEAIRLVNAGRPEDAESVCAEALLSVGAHAAILRTLGNIRHMRGNSRGAAEAFRDAVATAPEDAAAWADLGTVLGVLNDTSGAIDALGRAFSLDPANHAAGQNLGLALMKANRVGEAAEIFRRVVDGGFRDAAVLGWLGHAEAARDRPERAAEAYRAALDAKPGDENIELTLALVERDIGDLSASVHRLDRLITAQPENAVYRFAQAQNRLLTGDFESGFTGYEWRWRRPGMVLPEFSCPAWSGEDIAGKRLLLYDEQGLGDTLQFCRYATVAAAAGATVSLLVRPRLRRLMRSLDERIDFIDDEGAASRVFDYCAPLMSLPMLFGTTLGSVPADVPYLKPDRSLTDRWAATLNIAGDSRPRIGVVWQGDPKSQSERGRSVPFRLLSPLFGQQDKKFFLLQKIDGREQLDGHALPANVDDIGCRLDTGDDGFVDTAAAMGLMDLILTSDTGPAHLAGALACPTWLMVKKVPEWRWLLDRDDSPWYPTFRLYRQSDRGDWRGPLDRMARDLSSWQPD